MKKLLIICGLSCLFVACKPDVTLTSKPISGRANFSNYLAIGSSYTAGSADSSLTVNGQLYSLPALIFNQLALIPGDSGGSKSYFVQPLLHSDNGFPSAKFVLGYVHNSCTLDSSLSPIAYPNFVQDPIDAQRYTWQNYNYNHGQINNIGVPLIRMADFAFQGYGAPGNIIYNPYAARFFNDISTSGTPFDELNYRVRNLHPSFFTVALGMEDILGYVMNGGIGDGTGLANPVLPNLYQSFDITPYNLFYKFYDSVVRVATSTGATGALLNIPDITAMPLCQVIPSNGLVITRQSEADSLNAKWASRPRYKDFAVGNNQYMVYDNGNNIRQSVPGELILMTVPQNGLTCLGLGSFTPIPNVNVLTTDELQHIRTAQQLFNEFIYHEALKYNLAYVDVAGCLNNVVSGVVYNGVTYNANFVSGGAYSLDGVNLTQRGYALVANTTIAAIDSFYKATVPLADVNKYHGVLFP